MKNYSNTARTIAGFCKSFLARFIPALSKDEKLDDIYNYLEIKNLYATSGQPSEAQFQLIRDAGYNVVINLAPTSILENSVIEERQVLRDLGIRYIHIPVDFKNPTDEDFKTFVDSLDAQEKIWVHCAANMRVSAFTYRYRTQVLGESETAPMEDLQQIWNPIGVWSQFIRR